MRCKKCGSPYADISKTEDIGIGHARKTIYCAECKQTYTEDIQKNMPAGTIPIMIINKGYANFPLMVVSRNSQIGLSQWVDGDYTFCPLETCIFRYDGRNIELYTSNVGSDSVIGGRHVVQKLEFDPKYHVRFSNPKLISLFDEAISGRVSTLSNELVNELNNILIKESSKSIMTDWPNVRHNNHVKKWDVHSIDKKGCYVATAVYGSYDCPEVWTLRRYRDYYLAETRRGRAFIRAYYVISPTIVKWFGQTDWFKKMWKGKLDRMVKKLQRNGVESTPYDDPKW